MPRIGTSIPTDCTRHKPDNFPTADLFTRQNPTAAWALRPTPVKGQGDISVLQVCKILIYLN
jgi:hypothetical protein